MQMNKKSMKSLAALAAGVLAANVYGLTTPTVDYTTYVETPQPQGVLTTFVSGPDTRGFSWITDTSVTESKVWLLKGAYTAADDAKFASEGTLVEGTYGVSPTRATVNCHKVKAYGLSEGTYSYKLGGGENFVYGQFEVKKPSGTITILNMNDAQTKDMTKLSVWENTAARAKETAGDVDFIVYGGDFVDVGGLGGSTLAWGVSADTAVPHFPGVPWVMTSGNHDFRLYNWTMPVDYAWSYELSGLPIVGCQSFDYGNVHVAVLPIVNNTSWDEYVAQTMDWLENDLKATATAANVRQDNKNLNMGTAYFAAAMRARKNASAFS